MVLQEKSADAMPDAAVKEIRMLTATVAPGEASVWHTYEASPIVYVISGELRLEMKGRLSPSVVAGQGLVEPADVVMRAVNPSATVPSRCSSFR
jgi:quercetin dioxygenase-like cupin family protein